MTSISKINKVEVNEHLISDSKINNIDEVFHLSLVLSYSDQVLDLILYIFLSHLLCIKNINFI